MVFGLSGMPGRRRVEIALARTYWRACSIWSAVNTLDIICDRK